MLQPVEQATLTYNSASVTLMLNLVRTVVASTVVEAKSGEIAAEQNAVESVLSLQEIAEGLMALSTVEPTAEYVN